MHAETQPSAGESSSRRRRSVLLVGGLVLVILMIGGGAWWRREVKANPGLEFQGGYDLARDEAGTDRSGIAARKSPYPAEVDELEVGFVPNGHLYATVRLSNGGSRDVRIESAPRGAAWNWGFERIAVAPAGNNGAAGFTARYEPFRPFTLHSGEIRELRLEFRLADCNPATVNPGGYSVLRSLDLRYRILGISRTADVPFQDVAIYVPTMGDCAHPITDS